LTTEQSLPKTEGEGTVTMKKVQLVAILAFAISGCGTILNKSSADYKTPVLVPSIDRTVQGPGRCYIDRAVTEEGSDAVMEVSLNGTPESVGLAYSAMNGSSWQNAGMFLYDCALAETSYYSVGSNPYWNGQQGGGKEGELALKAVVTFLKKVRGDSSASQAPAVAPVPETSVSEPSALPAPTAPATAAPAAAPVPSSVCQDLDGVTSFVQLADVIDKQAAALTDPSEKKDAERLSAYLRDQGTKPNPDLEQLKGLKDTMKASYGCR
jgi:hypothetical protein